VTGGALVSFDIDGTLEVGDPPGIITVEMLMAVKHRGYLIGSCSDRPVSYQRQLWKRLAVLKHRLADVRARFPAPAYYHIGDTEVDAHYALAGGFLFLRADRAGHAAWGPRVFGE
jgi:hypothetical protein